MIKKTVCPLDCPDSCGILATVEDGKITQLAGDPDHPFTRGFICRKMKRYVEKVYSPDRIGFPMLRVGKKGEAKFKRINWDEAWAILAEKLSEIIKAHGGEAVLPFCYAGNMGKLNRNGGFPFFHKIGATRIEQTICSAASSAGWKKHCGSAPGSPPEKVLDSSLVVLWGNNTKVSNIHFWSLVKQARKNGAKLVVIDPYRNMTAKSADWYISIAPGGDSMMALGVIKSLYEIGLVDEPKHLKESIGFTRFIETVKKLSWQEITKSCSVKADDIRVLAEMFVKYPETFIRIGIGMTRNSRGGDGIRSILCLARILGLYTGDKGKGVLCSTGSFRGGGESFTHESLMEIPSRKINMIQLGAALTALDPPVKCLMVYNANPLSVAPDSATVRKGLERDDLFTVVLEHTMTPTARYADLLLPATTFLENRDLYTSYGQFELQVAASVIEPVGEAVSNFDFFQKLAGKMGFEDAAFKEAADERIASYLRQVDGKPETAEINAVMNGERISSTYRFLESDVLQATGNSFVFTDEADLADTFPLSATALEFDDPDLLCRFPLKLITPPHMDMLNSTFGEFYQGKEHSVMIHPQDAEQYSIKNGQKVALVNYRGTLYRKADISEDTQPGLVVAEGLFWSEQDGSNINELTSQKLCSLGGGSLFHEVRIMIKPAEQV